MLPTVPTVATETPVPTRGQERAAPVTAATVVTTGTVVAAIRVAGLLITAHIIFTTTIEALTAVGVGKKADVAQAKSSPL